MVNNEQLRRDVHHLGDLLGDIIKKHAGDAAFDRVETVRRLARERRNNVPGAEAKLSQEIGALSDQDARIVARAFSIFFDLTNLAEDRHRIRVLRDREHERAPAPIGESIGAAIVQLRDAGFSAEQTQDALDRLDIELVFTAHPSEAKRRSIRAKIRRMRQCLQQLDDPNLLARERESLETQLRTELSILWGTEFLRPMRPTVREEAERGMSIMPRLWEVIPGIYQSVRSAFLTTYPSAAFRPPAFLRFGTWVGGDRDGHPDVTARVTEQTLLALRENAIDRQLELAKQVYDFLTVSSRDFEADDPVAKKLNEALKLWPELDAALVRVAPRELDRRWIKTIEWRLRRSSCKSLSEPLADGAYVGGGELCADLELLLDHLSKQYGDILPDSPAQRWLDLSRVFGLHLMRLDVRQDARRYREVMTEIFADWGTPNFDKLPENERQAILVKTIAGKETIHADRLSPLGQDTLSLFRLLSAAIERFGAEAIGGHVISMTRTPSDVLTVLWFWQRACRERGCERLTRDLRIIPLFEKIGDLQEGPKTLAAILDLPIYAKHIASASAALGRVSDPSEPDGSELPLTKAAHQIVMVGYSDSTKDGGYLAASWGLYKAQDELQKVALKRGVRLTFFHGRGGSLGRGGGPAARGILSLPPDALGSSLRLTEQGEVLAERYDDVQIAYRHLDQVTWATLVASNLPAAPVRKEWLEMMEALAARSLAVYRQLVDEPGLIAYFEEASPIEEIENLPIASRPSRRTGQRTLGDLRAIPWVFSWTQNRCMIPAWYGLGAALTEVKYRDRNAWQTVCEMYRLWPFFQATIENAALALVKADMYIGQRYSELCADEQRREKIWTMIAGEFDRSRQAIMDIGGPSDLTTGGSWLKASLDARNPYIDPLNLMQIEFLARRRALPVEASEHESLRDLLRLTVQGIASGMRTTG